MNKDLIINKIVKDLPVKEMRSQMSDVEWAGWFEECWDKAINFTRCSTELKEKEVMTFEDWKSVFIIEEKNERFLHVNGGWWSYAEVNWKYKSDLKNL